MTDVPGPLVNALHDRYRIERELGQGGMATVYLAHDLRHDRQIAVKVLRSELAATLGSQRFLQEIQIAARLTHPHILPVHDSGEAGGFLYYVMPYVVGESLRDKLSREGELPVSEVVRILREITDALAYAHAHGVVHRDIKPENVMLSGRHALVTDFGVAKALHAATGPKQLTTAGIALGTPAYMAPEQAAADPHTDHRADLYAVGVMAYEMLTGRPPFTGSSPQKVLAAHVTEPPRPVTDHRPAVSPAMATTIMRCLEKKPADRWQTADELLVQLDGLASTPSGGMTPTDTRPLPAVKVPAIRTGRTLVIGVLGIVLVVIAAALLQRSPEERIEFGPVKPVTSDPGLEIHPALSPDGKMLAYIAGPIGQFKVYVRALSGGTPIPVAKDLPGNQLMPRWSPDGTTLLFAGEGSIYAVPSLGGTPRVVVEAGSYPAWSPDGNELAYIARDSLFVRAVAGGTPRGLAGGFELHSPAWSPDGRLIVYVSTNAAFWVGSVLLGDLAPSILMIVRAAGGEPITLSDRKSMHMSPAWMPDSRHLLFMSTQDGGRDLYSLALNGSGHARGPAVRLTTGLDIGTVTLSADGSVLAYSSMPNTSNIWAVPIPASGTVSEAQARQITTGTQHIEGVGVSRDGQWLAFDSDRQGNSNIYRVALAGGESQQITTSHSFDFLPSWSPDGKEVVFQSWRNETRDVFAVPAKGGEERLVAGGPAMESNADWSGDGKSVVFQSDRTGRLELYTEARSPDGTWRECHQVTREGGSRPRWSPDNSWIAYISPRGVELISPEGGSPRALVTPENMPSGVDSPIFAVWSPDSKTIYFKAQMGGHASFWAIPLDGGRPRLLARFEDPAFASARQNFATDGKRLYFTANDRQADIKAMEVRRPR